MQSSAQNRDERILHDANDRSNIVGDFFYNFVRFRMPPLVRYFSEKNAHAFVERGEVLFRALSYFRDYEDKGVRADEHEGTLVQHA